jgi:hypothetical protein
MLEAKKPNRFSAFVGGGIAVEEVTHCLVEFGPCRAWWRPNSADLVLGELKLLPVTIVLHVGGLRLRYHAQSDVQGVMGRGRIGDV